MKWTRTAFDPRRHRRGRCRRRRGAVRLAPAQRRGERSSRPRRTAAARPRPARSASPAPPAPPARRRCAIRPSSGTARTRPPTRASRPAIRRRPSRRSTRARPGRDRRRRSSPARRRARASPRRSPMPQTIWAPIISALRRSGCSRRRLEQAERRDPAHIAAEPDRAPGQRAAAPAEPGVGRREQRAAGRAISEMRGDGDRLRRSSSGASGRIDDLARRQRIALLAGQPGVKPPHRRGHRHRPGDAGDRADQEPRAELHSAIAGRRSSARRSPSPPRRPESRRRTRAGTACDSAPAAARPPRPPSPARSRIFACIHTTGSQNAPVTR